MKSIFSSRRYLVVHWLRVLSGDYPLAVVSFASPYVRHRALHVAFRNADQPFGLGKHLYHSRKGLGVVALSEIDEQPKTVVLLSGDTAVLFHSL